MKFAYKFSNLLGAVYNEGNLLFTPDGSSVISPVGNRISIFDLKNNKSVTLPIESRFNYNAIDISPNGRILIAINEDGEAHVISMVSKMILHKYRFKRKVRCVKFSPDGKYYAVCKESNVFVFKAPGLESGQFNPFVMERIFHDAVDDTTYLEWSFDSNILAVGSKDTSIRLYTLGKWKNFKKYSLTNHTDSIIGCYFEKKTYDLSTLSKNGHLVIWECDMSPDDLVSFEPPTKKSKPADSDSEDDIDFNKAIEKVRKKKKDEEEIMEIDENEVSKSDDDDDEDNDTKEDQQIVKLKYRRLSKHFLANEARKIGKKAMLTAAAYHRDLRILVAGFSNGSFFLYELPDVNMIHSLSISNTSISTISFNNSGDWIGIGCSQLGQLLVWEWESETYAMKQQGHSCNMNSMAYSPDAQYIVTGGDDGKVKLWNSTSGFCIVTFHEHTSSISDVKFSRNGKFIVSSSLDGSVRAFDLMRYRNFKTFTSPRPVQFSCVAIDSSDQFIAAGGQDVFEIFLWSIKLGKLLEILTGHEGPVVSIAFNPNMASTEMVSVSWDKTLKIWNAIETDSTHETIQLYSDGLCVTYKPNGEDVAVATLDGQILFFNCKTADQIGSIEGKNDLGSGRSDMDLITAERTLKGKAFTALSYSADGTCILAGGQSKNVCIYHVEEKILLKKFEITQNRSFDAVDDFINRRKMTEFGNTALIEEREELEGGNVTIKLPGVKAGDMAARSLKPEIRVYKLQFSPTGHSWGAVTTEGLLIYSLDTAFIFDPFELDTGITTETTKEAIKKKDYLNAIMMAIKLNEKDLIRGAIQCVKPKDIQLVVPTIPPNYIERLLKFLAVEFESNPNIQFYLMWIEHILTEFGPKNNVTIQHPVLLTLQKNMQKKYDDLSKICDFNHHTIEYMLKVGRRKFAATQVTEIEEMMSDTDLNDTDLNDVQVMQTE